MEPAPHRRHRPAVLRKRAILAAAVASLLSTLHSAGATVSWATNGSGAWTSGVSWSTRTLPGSADDVTIDRPAGNYTITLASGTQSINSLIDNENLAVSAGTLAVATTAQIGGTLTLNGGTLSGGTWTTTGTGTMSATGGTLSGVTLGGNLAFPSGTLTVTNGLTLNGGTLTIPPGPNYPTLNFSGSQALGGTGTLLLSGSGSILDTTGALTIGPAVTIATGSTPGPFSSNIYLGASGLNQGTISAQTTDQMISVIGTNWTNAGTLSASNGGTLRTNTNGSWTNTGTISVGSGGSISLSDTWSNLGTLNVAAGGKLTLGGTLTAASIGTLINNGSISIAGTYSNTGHTLTLDGSTFYLGSGTVLGGTVNTTGAGGNAFGKLNGVTVAGNLTVPSNAGLTVSSGLTLAGGSITLASTGGGSFLTVANFQTVGGTGSILFGGSGDITSTGYITFAPGVTIATAGVSSSGSISLGTYSTNEGTISAQVSGRAISVTGTSWINAGTLAASNGGTLYLEGSWTNTGTLNVGSGSTAYLSRLYAMPWSNSGTFNVATGGTLYLGGTFTAASIGALNNNGSVRIVGTLDNTGNTLTLDGSAFALLGGTITGGTINTTAGGANAYGTLNGVTVAGTLTVPGNLVMSNGLTLANGTISLPAANSGVTVHVSGAQTVGGTGTIVLGSGAGNGTNAFDSIIDVANGSLTFAPGITITTGSAAGWVLLGPAGLNQGTISSRTPGRTLLVSGANFTNTGNLSASNGGTLLLGGLASNTGTISIDPSATLVFGNATTPNGTINLSGTAIVNYTGASPADAVRQQLALGLARVTGIILPEASADPTRAIGYAEASTLLGLSGTKTAKWSGQTIDATTILLKPTSYGDANLDGVVNADDYALLDRSYAQSPSNPHWTDGDFNYDGTIDASDYLLIDTAYLQQQGGTPSPAFLSLRESQFGSAYVSDLLTSIPEPSSLLALVGVVFVRFRRRI